MIDSLMAASALERDVTIVTRNEDDFASTDVTILNPWLWELSSTQKVSLTGWWCSWSKRFYKDYS